MKDRRPLLLCVALSCLTLCVNANAANEANPERERARAAFAEGKALLEQERCVEAEKQFRAAQEFKKTAGLHYFIALSLEKQRRWLEARREYEAADELTRSQSAEDVARLLPEAFARVELALPRVSVVGMPAGARLVIDDRRVDEDTLRLDPGPHVVLVEADGYVSKRESFVLTEGENRVVAGGLEKARVEPTLSPPIAPSSLEPSSTSSWKPTVVWGGVAVGALGVGVGIAAVFLREEATREVEERGRSVDARRAGVSSCRDATGALGEDCAALASAVGRRDDASIWIATGLAAAGVGLTTAVLTQLLWSEEAVHVAPVVSWDARGRLEAGVLSVEGAF